MVVQAVTIRSHCIVSADNSKPYVSYAIQVVTKLKTYEVRRRYSEFERLCNQLKTEIGPDLARRCLPPLPAKSTNVLGFLTGSSGLLGQPDKIAERKAGLERWLRSVIVHKELRSYTEKSSSLADFLQTNSVANPSLASSKGSRSGAPTTNAFTSHTWLVEHNEIRSSIQEVYDLISQRDELLTSDGDAQRASAMAQAHRTNLEAKRLLAAINNRINQLAQSLQQFSKPESPKARAALTDGEVSRRAKLITNLQDNCERLGKMSIMAHSQLAPSLRHIQAKDASELSSQERCELLGSSSTGHLTTRVLGPPQGSLTDTPAEETSETRTRNNRQLMDYQVQQTIASDQDSKLRSLTQILLKQKQIGLLINQELVEQNEILDDLGNQVDSTSSKLREAGKKIDRLS